MSIEKETDFPQVDSDLTAQPQADSCGDPNNAFAQPSSNESEPETGAKETAVLQNQAVRPVVRNYPFQETQLSQVNAQDDPQNTESCETRAESEKLADPKQAISVQTQEYHAEEGVPETAGDASKAFPELHETSADAVQTTPDTMIAAADIPTNSLDESKAAKSKDSVVQQNSVEVGSTESWEQASQPAVPPLVDAQLSAGDGNASEQSSANALQPISEPVVSTPADSNFAAAAPLPAFNAGQTVNQAASNADSKQGNGFAADAWHTNGGQSNDQQHYDRQQNNLANQTAWGNEQKQNLPNPNTQGLQQNDLYAAGSDAKNSLPPIVNPSPVNPLPPNPSSTGSSPYSSGYSGLSPQYVENLRKPAKQKRRPSWAALIACMFLSAVLATVASVGVMTLRYDGTRPASLKSSEAVVKPVVETTGKTPDWEAVAKAVGPAVVAIEAATDRGGSSGSGVIIDREGHILTNDHVVSGARTLQVKLSDGRLFEAKLDGTDAATDLAVISLMNPPADLSVAALGTSQDLQVGQAVAAIGNPLGLSSTITSGIISALDRPVQTLNREARSINDARVVTNAIQLDAAVNPGNSGGPVFDASGRVIGIASSIATTQSTEANSGGSIGLGFAIPIDLAKNIAQQLIKNGVAEHAYLGVSVLDGIAKYGSEQRLGAKIESVEPDTPAAEAKLREGDVVVAVNQRSVVSAVSLTGYIRQYMSGEKVTLTIARNGELQDLDVVLATKIDQ